LLSFIFVTYLLASRVFINNMALPSGDFKLLYIVKMCYWSLLSSLSSASKCAYV